MHWIKQSKGSSGSRLLPGPLTLGRMEGSRDERAEQKKLRKITTKALLDSSRFVSFELHFNSLLSTCVRLSTASSISHIV